MNSTFLVNSINKNSLITGRGPSIPLEYIHQTPEFFNESSFSWFPNSFYLGRPCLFVSSWIRVLFQVVLPRELLIQCLAHRNEGSCFCFSNVKWLLIAHPICGNPTRFTSFKHPFHTYNLVRLRRKVMLFNFLPTWKKEENKKIRRK